MQNSQRGIETIYIIFAVVIVLLLSIGGFFLMSLGNSQGNDVIAGNTNAGRLAANTNQPSLNTNTFAENNVGLAARTILVTAQQWSFTPSTITVKKGEKVTLNIQSLDVAHGFQLPDFDVNATLTAGKTTSVTFTPDKVGAYSFSCSVQCGKGHADMTGKLVVQD
ncbi:MAG TPA: cupredoxin domain-containing protein [Patescibacteria group bacterium]|nr:cupredoxin domain-containing protein [Patescibacteria group bacterium]